LQKAKLSYIDKARDITMHPAFWAPFIQLGDSSPIQLQQQGSKWFWLLGIVGVLAVSFAFWRFGKQKKLP
ncbi:MAG: hypothetical protein ACI976_001734, partial [Aureispira sp.]